MQTIDQIFSGFKNLRVLIIGDLMVDSYSFGRVNRISPEAPVPVLNLTHRENRLGGAGNVVKNILSIGAKPIICSVIGNDSNGKIILELLKKEDISVEGIILEPNRITTSKERVISGSQQIVRIDEETEAPIHPDSASHILNFIKSQITQVDVLVFEDYDKGVLNKELIESIIQIAKQVSVPMVVDPKKKNFNFYQGIDLFKPNLSELLDGLKLEKKSYSIEQLKEISEQFRMKNSLKGVFLTMSEQGVLMNYLGEIFHIPAHVRNIADVSGAGDTVISVAACGIGLGLEPKFLAELSNLAGGLVCENIGVVPINIDQLFSEAKQILL